MESPPPDLSDQLLQSASRFAVSALDAREGMDPGVFLLHAATALEHLCKAVLAALHPTLIASDDFDSLLHAAGHGHHARRPPSRMTTISMQDALSRCAQLVPGLGRHDLDLQVLRHVRNGVVHLGYVDPGEIDRLELAFLRAVGLLLPEMDPLKRAFFWGPHADRVSQRLESDRVDTARSIGEAVSAAKAEFKRRFGSLEPAWREQRLAVIVAGYPIMGLEDLLMPCPACSTDCLLRNDPDIDYEADWEFDDGQWHVSGAYPKRIRLIASELICRACGLHLEGEEQLTAAGVDLELDLPEDSWDPGEVRRWEGQQGERLYDH